MADTASKKTLAGVLDAPLQAAGSEIPPGSYGATLYGFSEPWEMDTSKSKFRKANDPPTKTVFEAEFGVFDKNGVVSRLEYLLPFPDGGVTNRRSNVFKLLKCLASGTDLINEKSGAFKQGTTLKNFFGMSCILTVEKNDQDFPNVKGAAPMLDGVKKPTLEECQTIVVPVDAPRATGGDVPF